MSRNTNLYIKTYDVSGTRIFFYGIKNGTPFVFTFSCDDFVLIMINIQPRALGIPQFPMP